MRRFRVSSVPWLEHHTAERCLQVILEHQHNGDEASAPSASRPAADAKYVADIEQAMKLSECATRLCSYMRQGRHRRP